MSTDIEREQVDEREGAFIERFRQDVESDIRESSRLRTSLAGRVLRIGGVILLVTWLVGGRHFHGFPFWWFFIFAGTGATLQAARAARQRAAATLERAADPRLVGVLAGYAGQRDPIVRQGAARGLLRVLPHVQANHAALISRVEMDALIRLLQSWDVGLRLLHSWDLRLGGPALTIALLKAMEQVGDARALPVVERLSRDPEWIVTHGLPFETRRRVQEAARECLPYLQDRAKQERLRSTLLRATESPVDPGRTLLRPAANSSDTPPEQLLRPAAEE